MGKVNYAAIDIGSNAVRLLIKSIDREAVQEKKIKKVLLLRMSLSGANVLILDEPTRNFSPLSGPVIRKMLREFPGAVISISHDRKYIEEVCDKIYQLNPNGLQLIGD